MSRRMTGSKGWGSSAPQGWKPSTRDGFHTTTVPTGMGDPTTGIEVQHTTITVVADQPFTETGVTAPTMATVTIVAPTQARVSTPLVQTVWYN